MNRIMFIIGLIIAAMTTGMSVSLQAQDFRISPEVGYERTAYHLAGKSHKAISTKSGNGLRIGASAAYGFGNGLSLQSGIFYSHRGGGHIYGINDSQAFPTIKDIHLRTMDFLTVPLTVGYEFKLGSKWGIGAEAGGYIAAGLGSGNAFFRCANGEGSGGSVFDESAFTVATSDGYDRDRITIKGSSRADAGCVFGAHVRFDRIRLRATYQLGLCKTVYDMAIPRTFAISLAYDFSL